MQYRALSVVALILSIFFGWSCVDPVNRGPGSEDPIESGDEEENQGDGAPDGVNGGDSEDGDGSGGNSDNDGDSDLLPGDGDGNGDGIGDGIGDGEVVQPDLVTCSSHLECASDEACTQGGHCVNTTGVRSATAAFQADFDQLEQSVATGIFYRLPPNGIYLLTDLNGDGVALRVDKALHLDGGGSKMMVDGDLIGLRLEPGSEYSTIRALKLGSTAGALENEAIGIDIAASKVGLDDLYLKELGTALRVYGDAQQPKHSQQWTRLVFEGNHHYAADLRHEVNHSLFIGFEILSGAGIKDDSTRGNTYVGMVLRDPLRPGLRLTGVATTHSVVGTWKVPSGPAVVSTSSKDLHMGGNTIRTLQGEAERLGQGAARLGFQDPQSAFIVQIPAQSESVFAYRHPGESDWWRLRYFPLQNQWGLGINSSNVGPFFWTGAGHPQGPGQRVP